VDRLTNPEVLQNPQSLSPEAIHQAVLQVSVSNGYLPDRASLATAEMSLALHSATPKIEGFYNYYEDHHKNGAGTECGSWVDWYGQVVCDVETLAQLAGIETIDAKPSSNT
jgi:UDP-glucose:glycoprotein glucosyltransferase